MVGGGIEPCGKELLLSQRVFDVELNEPPIFQCFPQSSLVDVWPYGYPSTAARYLFDSRGTRIVDYLLFPSTSSGLFQKFIHNMTQDFDQYDLLI